MQFWGPSEIIHVEQPIDVAKTLNVDPKVIKSLFAGDKIKLMRKAYKMVSEDLS